MKIQKDIFYNERSSVDFHAEKHKLDIILPDIANRNTPVLVFIHGGMWIYGSKDSYLRLGQRFCEMGVGLVAINYRLATDFRNMAADCARALKYVAKNVSENIAVMGHSAGGHLAALVSMDRTYTTDFPAVQKCILLDAFGLCLNHYIKVHGAAYLHYVEQIFTRKPELWDKASPASFIHDANFPFLIYTGANTYPFLKEDNHKFAEQLKKQEKPYILSELRGKSHQEMITQFSDKTNPVYEEIVSFINS